MPGTLDLLLEVAVDLTANLSSADRYQRLVTSIRKVVPADAVALLRLGNGVLEPIAINGLAPEVLGRSFQTGDHPRLDAILKSADPVRFAPDDPRPDPYDGHLEGGPDCWMEVHSCMGCALRLDGSLVGALTLDAAAPGVFDCIDDRVLAALSALAAAVMQTAQLIEALEKRVERRSQLTRHFAREALLRGGGELLGASPSMKALRADLEVVAGSDLTVLITGETGTGKELVARTLHARSSRADQPLVYVNCAALPESIAESELFGHLRGAFTGAVEDRPGKFELADGGTLFLDEIGELPPSIQPKLLRALQEGDIQRIGSGQDLRVDVRVVAATNRDLGQEVRAGRFRPDLYHRLSVYPVHVPALRERDQDVTLLAGHFLDRARTKLGLGPMRFTREALRQLESYLWPGNVRELEHVITRGALRASGPDRAAPSEIQPYHLGFSPSHQESLPEPVPSGLPAPEPRETTNLKAQLDQYQAQLISRTVAQCGENWAEAARRLEVDRGNLFRRARRLGLR
jgi:anaerobic nitric oxide reductase transcription regulator